VGIKKNIENAQVQIGHKRKKNTALTDEQKLDNQALAKVRIVGEHAIGGLKRYYIVRNENRMKKPTQNPRLDNVVEICGALWNFRRGFTTKAA
jgi:DDE superfamily endonuclease